MSSKLNRSTLWLGLAAMLLTGCSSAPNAGASLGPAPASPSASVAPGPQVGIVTAPRQPTAADRPGPQPGAMYQTDTFTVEQWQQQLAASLGVKNPPPVAVTQVVRGSEVHPLWAACVESQGFKPFGDAVNGGLGVEYRVEQEDAAMLVSYTCRAQYPPPPEFYQPYSSEILKRIRQHIVDVQMPCLEQAGYPPVEVMSFESYEARYRIDRSLWNPVIDANAADVCPASAPEDVILPR